MPTHLHSACVHARAAHALHGPSLTQRPETLLAGRQVRGVVAAGDRHVTDSPMLSAWPRENEGQSTHGLGDPHGHHESLKEGDGAGPRGQKELLELCGYFWRENHNQNPGEGTRVTGIHAAFAQR